MKQFLRKQNINQLFKIAGYFFLAVWLYWWTHGIYQNHLQFSENLWFGKYPAFGVDFIFNVDKPSRTWVQGKNPYTGDAIYPYPPIVHRIFAWTSLTSPKTAMILFMGSLALFAGIGAYFSWKTRNFLTLSKIQFVYVLCFTLFSFPVIFAIERGNYDLTIIPFIAAAIWFLDKDDEKSEIIAGAVLSVTPWLKIYPGLIFFGLIALKRWRAFTSFTVSAMAIGLACYKEIPIFLAKTLEHIEFYKKISLLPNVIFRPWQHSLAVWWRLLWSDSPIGGISGEIVTIIVCVPLLVYVSINIYRCPNRRVLTYPYLIWILALATFVPSISNDYNLFFLPLTALAVWDKRDPIILHLLMAPLMLWWQPIYLPINGYTLFLFKFTGLIVLSVIIVRRAHEIDNRILNIISHG